MSSRGTVPAWVIEKQQKQIALQREAKRRQQVRQQIAAVAAEVRTNASALNTQEIQIWAKDEFDFVQKTVDSTATIVDSDVDFVLKRLHESKAILEQIQTLSEDREREHQRMVEKKTIAYRTAVESVK